MHKRAGQILFSPSDLNAFLECEHLTQLEFAVARHEVERPVAENPQADLVKRKGDEHEAAYLAQLLADGRTVTEITLENLDFDAAAQATADAMREGADVIYQACFVDGRWRGFADFVERQADGRYEVVDTKLARHSKPSYVLQLCFYSEQVGRIQGSLPERMHVVLGTKERESLRVDDFMAYYRRVLERFVAAVDAGIDVYPLPVSFCGRCDFRTLCEARWVADDHVTLVAWLRRDQSRRLEEAGIPTVAALAVAPDEARPAKMAERAFESLRDQAAMQVAARDSGGARVEAPRARAEAWVRAAAAAEPGRPLLRHRGRPVLGRTRGASNTSGGSSTRTATSRPFWATIARRSAAPLEGVDRPRSREHRAADPACTSTTTRPTRSPRSSGSWEYGTREEELDELLRAEVFVDLYKVVRKASGTSQPGYGLKEVETFYFERTRRGAATAATRSSCSRTG